MIFGYDKGLKRHNGNLMSIGINYQKMLKAPIGPKVKVV